MQSEHAQPQLKFDKWFVHCATLGLIGRIPKAPGTFGSLPGVVLGWAAFEMFINSPTMTTTKHAMIASILILAITAFSWVTIAACEKYWGAHDRKEIVIDELAGQFIPIIICGTHFWTLALSFAFFRFFDILKPWPVGHIDKEWPGAHGTLFDDIAAGIMAAVLIFPIHHLWS